MDRLLREGNPPAGQLASPKPQYKKPGVDEYAPVEGQHGAPFATLKDASGNIVSPATEDKLEQVRQLLAGVATEAKLEQARTLLNTISNKDFATQATLEVVQSELALIKSELANIKANQLSGDQKVQLSGTMVKLQTYTFATNVAPGSSVMIEVIPPTGRTWTIQALQTAIEPPTGATSGTHVLHTYLAGQQIMLGSFRGTYTDRVSYVAGRVIKDANLSPLVDQVYPSNPEALAKFLVGLKISASVSLRFQYTNNTDVVQEKVSNWIRLSVIEEG